jgi:hypothetical protein
VIAALYPNVEPQMSYIVSQKSVCNSNINVRQTNLKNCGKLGEGKEVYVATKSKPGGYNLC